MNTCSTHPVTQFVSRGPERSTGMDDTGEISSDIKAAKQILPVSETKIQPFIMCEATPELYSGLKRLCNHLEEVKLFNKTRVGFKRQAPSSFT